MADSPPTNVSEAGIPISKIWIPGVLLGGLVYLALRTQTLKQGLEGTASHHETLAHRYAARGTSRACSTQGLKALLAAQTAFVHAQESGNATLTKRLERQRDEILERSNACCYGGGR